MSQPSPFDLNQPFDVIVVGAGAAGLYAALCLPAHLSVAVISKEPLTLSASDWAQGGIAAVIDPNDSTELHVRDTLEAGAGLCDLPAVQFLVEQAPDCIYNLVQMGVAFDREDGNLALTLEAAHSRRRVLHAADTTGRAVISILTSQVLSRKNIQVLSPGYTLDLWLDASQKCQGICLLYQGQLHWLPAAAVILATGGGGQVFARTTNPALSTGDGVAIAYRAGAILRDLEFFQFHPTALTKPGAPHFLISEAVRGEGAHLVDDQGRRFAFDYHPAGELAPRDVVSRAIYQYLQATHTDPASAHVWLDLRPIAADTIRHRFPNIIQVCREWGIDVFREPIPVTPAAHYWMGGIAADLMNRTSIKNLYAVGETASTGVHGANRLASNSLLECVVFGSQFATLELTSLPASPGLDASPVRDSYLDEAGMEQIKVLRQELPRLVWKSAGICREGSAMATAIDQLAAWQQEFTVLPYSQTLLQSLALQTPIAVNQDQAAKVRLWAETRNLLEIALLILNSAAFRTESRGGHYRSDYPKTSLDWQVHTLVQSEGAPPNGNARWWQAPVQQGL